MDAAHVTSDRQSWLLTRAAVEVLKCEPALASRALATLDHWQRVAPAGSQALRDEWREIMVTGAFDRALALNDRGQQLRQASPLGRVLPAALRLKIIRSCKGRNSST